MMPRDRRNAEEAEGILPTLPRRSNALPRRPSLPRSQAQSTLLPLVALLLVALVAGACSGKKHRSPVATSPSSTSSSGTVALQLKLSTSAEGPERGFNARDAAKRVAPGLEQFLTRYLSSAFLQPSEAQKGWRDLLALFDGAVEPSARQQLDSLSLGSAASQVTAVRPGPASATAVALFQGGHPVAATVRLAFDGTADSTQGSGAVRLRAVFQLLNPSAGWRIASFQSSTGSGS